MEYKASLDNTAKIITVLVIAVFVYLGYRSIHLMMLHPDDLRMLLVQGGVLLLFLVLIIGSYLMSPRYYRVENDNLVIVRPAKNKLISLDEIASVRILDPNEAGGAIRTFGNGGLFGYYGKYFYPKFGRVTLYTSQRKNRILIETKQGFKFMISPDDTDIIQHIERKKHFSS
ncbi:MAG: PH domain-containing protein [Microbacter sp.]